jgi:hypothetical protein
MTAKMAKPKPRKKAATPVAPNPAAPNERSNVDMLLARYKFLEADQSYQSTAAATADESNRLLSVHSREIDTIREKLASAVPETFSDAMDLLRFAIREVKESGGSLSIDELEISIFSNVTEALSDIRENFAKAVHDAAYDLMLARMADVSKTAKEVHPLFCGDVLSAAKL